NGDGAEGGRAEALRSGEGADPRHAPQQGAPGPGADPLRYPQEGGRREAERRCARARQPAGRSAEPRADDDQPGRTLGGRPETRLGSESDARVPRSVDQASGVPPPAKPARPTTTKGGASPRGPKRGDAARPGGG